jgi:hypothetical protein
MRKTPTPLEWERKLLRLSWRERGAQWQLGDLYNLGKELFGRGWCRELVESTTWMGCKYSTLKTYASVAKRFPAAFRSLNVDHGCYQQVASLPNATALPLLMRANARAGTKIECGSRRGRLAGSVR